MALAFSNALRTFYSFIYRPTVTTERELAHGSNGRPYFVRRLIFSHDVASIFAPYLFAPLERLVVTLARALRLIQSGQLNFYLSLIGALLIIVSADHFWRSDCSLGGDIGARLLARPKGLFWRGKPSRLRVTQSTGWLTLTSVCAARRAIFGQGVAALSAAINCRSAAHPGAPRRGAGVRPSGLATRRPSVAAARTSLINAVSMMRSRQPKSRNIFPRSVQILKRTSRTAPILSIPLSPPREAS